MSTSRYRSKLHFITLNNQRYLILECLKSEGPSGVSLHNEDGTIEKINSIVASWHAKKDKTEKSKPKTIHVPIVKEGIYHITGQQLITGWYCFYKGSDGSLFYNRINENEISILLKNVHNGMSYKESLMRTGRGFLF